MRRAQVLELLARFEPLRLPISGFRPAAVLAPLKPLAGDPEALELLLTRRTADLPSHAGQVSFPGGRIDDGDGSPEAAALRELEEELGVPREAVRLVGRLDHMLSVTGFHITPVVGLLPAELELHPAPREVARVFTLPLAVVLDPSAWELREHHYGDLVFHSWHLPWDGEDIWGVTARMLRSFMELLTGTQAATPDLPRLPG
jgi:8-oxo-dGTP pyrophosphatase MutT (NUDIX family)